MSTAAVRLITAEEFARMPQPPDGSRQELVQGVIVTMPPAKSPHGACCSRIHLRLGAFVEANKLGQVFINDTGFILERDPDTVRGADVSFWSAERLPEIPEGYITFPPDLAVEVVSPGDHFARIQRKVVHYLTKGIRLLWVADPQDRSVTVYHPGELPRILEENDTLTGEGVVPGFSCRVGDLFP
ncbi:MAG: Uma2 family endonuclease [Planctomycetes bacterium]|nr:Uma2 family endonuclease [Planctomycetota bacterium]